MIKGEKIRLDAHNILYSIYNFNKTLNNQHIKKIISKHKKEDISFINNVILNTMRFHLHTSKIINMYIKQISRTPIVENRIQGGDQEGQHCKATAHRRVSSAIMRKSFHCCDWLSKFLKQVF